MNQGDLPPVVIGIGGGTASGKTTLTQALRQHLAGRCLHIAHDDYYHPLPEAYQHRPDAWNFDHPRAFESDLLARHLGALQSGETVYGPEYHHATMLRISNDRQLAPREIILVEGILVLAIDTLRPHFHHRVFVDTPDPVRLERRMARDVQSRGQSPCEILHRWEKTVDPMHQTFVEPSAAHADLVVDGEQPVDNLVKRILVHCGL